MNSNETQPLLEPISIFVGREEELRRIDTLLRDGNRLVTILGPGGIGKTRLAIRYAARVWSKEQEGSLAFVDLEGATGLGDLIARTAASLDAHVATNEDVALAVRKLGRSVQSKGRLLVVLDNCESLAGDAATLANELLMQAPELLVLATSRERLEVAGEVTLDLAPLAIPADGSRWVESEAGRLFHHCAESARQGSLEGAPPAVIADLLAKLEGVPLIIELSAARLRVMSLRELLASMAEPLETLAFGPRSLPARHRAMRAALDGSWVLLNREERKTLIVCSLFVGAFGAEAAMSVLGVATFQEATFRIQRLVDKSLVRTTTSDDSLQFRLLDTIRHYALSKGEEPDSLAEGEARHARYFLDLAEGLARQIETRGAESDLRALQELMPNLALLWANPAKSSSTQRHDPDIVARAVLAAAPAFLRWRPHEEYVELAASALKELPVGALKPSLSAALRLERAKALMRLARWSEALADIDVAAEHANEEDDHELALKSTLRRAQLSTMLGRMQEARTHGMRLLDMAVAAAPLLRAELLALVGFLTMEVDNARGAALFARAIATLREIRNRQMEVTVRANFALAEDWWGSPSEAQRLYELAVSRTNADVDSVTAGMAYQNLGSFLRSRIGCDRPKADELDTPQDLYESALDLFDKAGATPFVAECKINMAGILVERGELEEALSTYEANAEQVPRNRAFTFAELSTCRSLSNDPQGAKLALALAKEEAGGSAIAVRTIAIHDAIQAWLAHKNPLAEVTLSLDSIDRGKGPGIERLRMARRWLDAICRPTPAAGTIPVVSSLTYPIPVGASKLDVLLVARDATWFQLPKRPAVDLRRRRQSREVFRVIVERAAARPGEPVTVQELLEGVWRNQSFVGESGNERIYTIIGNLRRLGLRRHLITLGAGYLLDPGSAFAWADGARLS